MFTCAYCPFLTTEPGAVLISLALLGAGEGMCFAVWPVGTLCRAWNILLLTGTHVAGVGAPCMGQEEFRY